MNLRNENTLTSFLSLLDVKHTKEYSHKLYNEHPHKYNLLGLSKMLSDYGINNLGIKLQHKDLASLETPFIAYLGSNFVIVHKITEDKVSYIWNSRDIDIPMNDFKEYWTGIALLAETDENSIEPNYKSNRKKEL